MFLNKPRKLAAGASVEVKLLLDGKSYYGTFSKFMHLPLRSGKMSKDYFLPVRFSVGEVDDERNQERKIKQAESESGISFIDYKGGGLEKHPDASAWVFAGNGCPGCNFLKHELLPKLLKPDKTDTGKFEVVMVNLDKKENLLFLMEVEKQLGSPVGDKTPILFYKGKLYYGNDRVKELIAGS